ncbi:hypothetical protein ACA910_016344 [Epithemia clementina (nom. ined.)]
MSKPAPLTPVPAAQQQRKNSMTNANLRARSKSPKRSAAALGAVASSPGHKAKSPARRRDKSPYRPQQPRRRRASTRGDADMRSNGGSQSTSRKQTNSTMDDQNSVGSALSISDQFDIILPIKPAVLGGAAAGAGLRAFDDVSSITTDEYRKYGGLLWRLTQNMSGGGGVSPTGGGGGCCAPLCPCTGNPNDSVIPGLEPSTSRTINTNANTRTTAGRMGGYRQHTGEKGGKDNMSNGDNNGAGACYNMCCGVYPEKGDSCTAAPRYALSCRSSKRDQSVDRTASLFDETLSEPEPNPDPVTSPSGEVLAVAGAVGGEAVEQEYMVGGMSAKDNKKWRLPWNRRSSRRNLQANSTMESSNNNSITIEITGSGAGGSDARGRTLAKAGSTEQRRGRSRSADRRLRKSRGRSATPQPKQTQPQQPTQPQPQPQPQPIRQKPKPKQAKKQATSRNQRTIPRNHIL